MEPILPAYNILTATLTYVSGQRESAARMLEATPQDATTGYQRNVYLATVYAAEGRYREAADILLAIPQEQNRVSRRSIEDAARLIRSAPSKTSAPDSLPVLEGELNFVYAHVGAPDRVLEYAERIFALDTGNAAPFFILWDSINAPLRKTERFKALARDVGLVDYWRARGWPDLCHPMGADDFVCD